MADDTSTPKAVLQYSGGEHEMAINAATDGASAFDISKLLPATGMVTLDSGYGNTAGCISEITYIDGDAGILRYRGYPIEELAEKASFLEVSWLLIYGEMPTTDELNGWKAKIRKHTMLHEDFREFFGGFMMFIYSGLLILINRRVLPGPIRIRGFRLGALVWSIGLFGVLSVLTAIDKGKDLFG